VKTSIRASALVIGIAAGVGLVAPLAIPASAAIVPSVACAKETSPPIAKSGGKLSSTLASCTPAALAAGGTSLTAVKANQTKGTLTDTITWKGGKGTTVAIVKYGNATGVGKCKKPYDSRIAITGTVKSATGAAAKITKKGEPVSASICAVSKAGPTQGQTTVEPGTKFKL
jgi:hypothetical protein